MEQSNQIDAVYAQKYIRKLYFWAPGQSFRAAQGMSHQFSCTLRESFVLFTPKSIRKILTKCVFFSFLFFFFSRRNSCILLDCGEGTCGQIARFYGAQSIEIIRKIKAVFISHMHADHYHGLLRLMELRKELMPDEREPLKLFSPKNEMKSWLYFYDNNVDAIHDDLMLIENRNLVCDCERLRDICILCKYLICDCALSILR